VAGPQPFAGEQARVMEWVIIAILCLVAVPIVYQLLKGTVNFLAKLALVIVSVAIVGAIAYYLTQ